MLIVTGYILVDPSVVDGFLADIDTFGRVTRDRDGCLFYAVVPDDRAIGRMLVVERWRDQAALSAHLHADTTASFVERWQKRMKGDVRKYDAANERPLTAA